VSDWILVTGFGPFPGVEINPTQLLAERLSGAQFQGLSVVSVVLDGSFDRSAIQLHEALANGWPRFIVHLGVSTGAGCICVETQGVNCMSAEIPDVDGQLFQSSVVNASYPLNTILRTSIPTEQLAISLRDNGYPANSSDDAGRYVCNATYFNSLSLVAESGTTTPSVFIHIPSAADPGDKSSKSWSLDRLHESMTHIIDWIVNYTVGPSRPYS